jgi:hypothetical protein
METQFERFLGTKGIVLYKSKYSATKRYAEMLVSAVPFDFMDISKVNVRDLINYDVIVYGGGIYASGIAGLGFLKKNMENLSGKRIILFCVGASPYSKKAYDEIRNKNLTGALSNVPLYYCRGFYEFLLQASSFEDVELHKKYNFVTYVLAYINIKHPGGGYNLDGKIKATNFVQKKSEEHVKSDLVAQPVVKLATAENFSLTEDKVERLSQIIAEINSRTGKSYDNDVAVKAMLQIRDILLKSEKLKTSAKNNSEKDFEFSYFDNIDDALIEGLDQNQDFFSLLLGNDEIKHEVLGIFAEEIYKSLREA